MKCKRFFSACLAFVLLLATFATTWLILPAQAATADDHLEYALFPMDILDINRTNNKNLGYKKHTDGGSHQYNYSFDFGGSDTTLVAPFTLRLISTGGDHSVIFESVNKVRLANGEVDYLTCMFTHDNNISDLVKKDNYTNDVFYKDIIAQGEKFYDQGTYKNVGRHVHVEIARGRVCSKSKTFGQNLTALRSDSCGIQVQDALYVKASTKLTDHNNLNWRIVSEVTYNDGAGHTMKRYYPVDTTYGILPTPAKADRKFLGWYTAKTGGTKITATTTVPKKNQTFYAQWDSATLAAPLTWAMSSPTSVSQTNAQLMGFAVLASKPSSVQSGYYIGADPNFLTKSSHVVTGGNLIRFLPLSFDLNACGDNLLPGTTYYYQFYVTLKNVEYRSELSSFTTPAPDIDIKWTNCTSNNITQTNATIQGQVTYGKTVTPERCGFYIGTSENNLTKSAKYDTINTSRQYSNISYNLNASGHTLKADTTYYYQFYTVIDGKEYKSPIESFTTKPAAVQSTTPTTTLSPTWSNCSASSITPNSATIQGKVTYGKAVTPERCGFYIGTSKDNLTKSAKYDTINAKREYSNISYNLSNADMVLYPSTTYYYQFYVVVDGKEYTSPINSFTSSKAPLSPTWSNCAASSITTTNATIKGKVTYGKTVTPERCGFYIGTSSDTMVKAEKYDTINAKRTYSNMSYDLKKYGQILQAGSTYYYQFYVIVDGVEYRSSIMSFKASS